MQFLIFLPFFKQCPDAIADFKKAQREEHALKRARIREAERERDLQGQFERQRLASIAETESSRQTDAADVSRELPDDEVTKIESNQL